MTSASDAAPDPSAPDGPAEHDSPHGGLAGALDRFQRRHTWAGFPLAVVYKFFDDFGSYLSALITYYAFVSLFPLLLLLSTGLGFVLAGNPHLQQQILDSALAQFPVVGDQLGDPSRLGGGIAGLVIGTAVSLYGGLGVAQALQYATNTAWSVPRNRRPNPFKARLRSLLLLGTAGLAILGTTALSAWGASGAGSLGVAFPVVALAVSVLINAVVFVLAFRVSTTRDLSVRDVVPGAVSAAVAWQLLQTFGVAYVGRGHQGRERDQRRLRPRAGAARLPLPRGRRHRPEHRGQRRASRQVVSALAADTIHRRRRPHPRRPAHLCGPGQRAAQQGVREHRRQLRPGRSAHGAGARGSSRMTETISGQGLRGWRQDGAHGPDRAEVATTLGRLIGRPSSAAYVCAVQPTPREAVARWRESERVVVATLLTARRSAPR